MLKPSSAPLMTMTPDSGGRLTSVHVSDNLHRFLDHRPDPGSRNTGMTYVGKDNTGSLT